MRQVLPLDKIFAYDRAAHFKTLRGAIAIAQTLPEPLRSVWKWSPRLAGDKPYIVTRLEAQLTDYRSCPEMITLVWENGKSFEPLTDEPEEIENGRCSARDQRRRIAIASETLEPIVSKVQDEPKPEKKVRKTAFEAAEKTDSAIAHVIAKLKRANVPDDVILDVLAEWKM